jgi:hypothetical protein
VVVYGEEAYGDDSGLDQGLWRGEGREVGDDTYIVSGLLLLQVEGGRCKSDSLPDYLSSHLPSLHALPRS